LSILRPVHVDDFELAIAPPEAFADLGQMLQHRQGETGDGGIIPVLGQLDAEPIGQHVGGNRARNPPAAVVALDQGWIGVDVHVGDELAGQSGEQVERRHQTFKMPIFVVDEGHRHLGIAEHIEGVHRVHLVGHDRRRTRQRR
jgi:uncharacterized protein YcfJ